MPNNVTAPARLDDLRRQIKGRVFTADDPDYGDVVACWNRAKRQAPAMAVVAEDASDIGRPFALPPTPIWASASRRQAMDSSSLSMGC